MGFHGQPRSAGFSRAKPLPQPSRHAQNQGKMAIIEVRAAPSWQTAGTDRRQGHRRRRARQENAGATGQTDDFAGKPLAAAIDGAAESGRKVIARFEIPGPGRQNRQRSRCGIENPGDLKAALRHAWIFRQRIEMEHATGSVVADDQPRPGDALPADILSGPFPAHRTLLRVRWPNKTGCNQHAQEKKTPKKISKRIPNSLINHPPAIFLLYAVWDEIKGRNLSRRRASFWSCRQNSDRD
jgi:hypothetical protein